MAAVRSRYDPELQMFVDQIREPDLARLRFLRWLGEQGRLEHETAGVAVGELAPGSEPGQPVAAFLDLATPAASAGPEFTPSAGAA